MATKRHRKNVFDLIEGYSSLSEPNDSEEEIIYDSDRDPEYEPGPSSKSKRSRSRSTSDSDTARSKTPASKSKTKKVRKGKSLGRPGSKAKSTVKSSRSSSSSSTLPIPQTIGSDLDSSDSEIEPTNEVEMDVLTESDLSSDWCNDLTDFPKNIQFSGTNILRQELTQTSASVRFHNFDGETYSKTNLSLITKEDDTHNYIEAYSTYGFRLTSGFSILGPCAIFPRMVLHWNVPSAEKITPASLSLFCMLYPKLDVLILGKGDWDAKIDKEIIRYLRMNKINVEILPTEQACSTFNFLNSERRVVAAGLIPPLNVDGADDQFYIEDDRFQDLERTEAYEDRADLLEVTKTMKELKEKGLVGALAEREKHRKRSSGQYRTGDDEMNNEDDKSLRSNDKDDNVKKK